MTFSFSDLLASAPVTLDLPKGNEEETIRAVAGSLAENPAVADTHRLIREVWEREKLSATAMGLGVAFPHARTDAVSAIVMAIGRSVVGMSYRGADEPVHFLFVIGTPAQPGSAVPRAGRAAGPAAQERRGQATVVAGEDRRRGSGGTRRRRVNVARRRFGVCPPGGSGIFSGFMDAPTRKTRLGTWLLPLLRLRIRLAEFAQHNETQTTLFWAGIVGFIGGASSVAFRKLTDGLLFLFTQHAGGHVAAFAQLGTWSRVAIPTAGGFLAGLTIFLGARFNPRKSSTDYMEAIVLGQGALPARSSFVKIASAAFSISSGGSIGREGPLVQLAAVLASLTGRWMKLSTAQLRLLVACGAAGGIASAYNAPIGGALFVAEIILGTLAMESFGPLVFSSVVATLTVRQFLGSNPLYEINLHGIKQVTSNWQILPELLLGVTAGLAAPWFLRGLRASEKLFAATRLPPYLRLALGGLAVGALATVYPEVCGNGYSVINTLLHDEHLRWQLVAAVLVFKLLATAATFGSGAVGGVFTPTLFAGASLGYLFGTAVQALWPGTPPVLSVFILVGMGALLAGTTHAPIMAIIILFEITLDYDIILPLMLACVVAHYTASAVEPASIYSESLKRKGAAFMRRQLTSLRVVDLMKKDPVAVGEVSRFTDIAESFLTHRFNYLYVVGEGRQFKGAISLHDVKSYLNDPELASIVIARDIVHDKFPTVAVDESLGDALGVFSRHDGERLPVTTNFEDRTLVGSISKTDVLLALSEQSNPLSSTHEAAVRGEAVEVTGEA